MSTKDSKLYSVIHQTCPRCHEGKMFTSSTYSSQFMKMNKSCPHCGLDLIQEPSYYFGAMYFSYAIQVAVFVMVYFGLRYTINPDSTTYIIWTIISVLLILPFNYRISRVMWINLFVSYEASSKPITNIKL
jgi:uncharacterized protein (DUF983 family)